MDVATFRILGILSATPMQQNLPKFSKIYPKTITVKNFEIPPKFEILVFFQKKYSAFFIVQKQSLYVNFNISLHAKTIFSWFHISYMRFCNIIFNSLKNKNLKFLNPYLLQKMGFCSPTHCCILWPHKKNFYFNFELYGLANDRE
jgi:hypothetical protein